MNMFRYIFWAENSTFGVYIAHRQGIYYNLGVKSDDFMMMICDLFVSICVDCKRCNTLKKRHLITTKTGRKGWDIPMCVTRNTL